MGRRRTVSVVLRSHAPSPPPPNATVEQVTVDVRVAFPPGSPPAQVEALVARAVEQLRAKLADGRTDP